MDGTSGSAKGTFKIPMLKLRDIIQCMAEMGIEATKEELQEPEHHKEKLRKIYKATVRHDDVVVCFVIISLTIRLNKRQLKYCTGMTEKYFGSSPEQLAKAQTLDHPELHQNFGTIPFFNAMRKMMKACGYDSFSLRDLDYPEAPRVRVQLSAIINDAKFVQRHMEVREKLKERVRRCFVENRR